jgi:L-alanine-DL-glutamate epimerase-like enolase superfamily enzyme
VLAVIREALSGLLIGRSAYDLPRCWRLMTAATRNLGEAGLARMAVAAVDTALWDLKAKVLQVPLVLLLGRCRVSVPLYGSGGFTSYTLDELRAQLSGWVAEGIPGVKMKIGREPGADPERVRAARKAIGPKAELFVDANGAYDRKQALEVAQFLSEQRVTWFEEPVCQDDLEGLRLLRDRLPPGIALASGEYGFSLADFQRLLRGGAVDVLMADVTRCGITGFLEAATLCAAHNVPLSSHCAPALHLHPCCAAGPVRHMEYFHDHVRIERLLLDGMPEVVDGALEPDLDRPGHGLEFKEADARKYEVG